MMGGITLTHYFETGLQEMRSIANMTLSEEPCLEVNAAVAGSGDFMQPSTLGVIKSAYGTSTSTSASALSR